ncbi:MAG: peroxiredoxin family protein [Planctomycetota bacterium]
MVGARRLGWLLAVAGLVGASGPLAEARIARGMRAAPLDARTADGAAPIRLSDRLGRTVLLSFFGTACPHCRRAVPRLNELAARGAPLGVDVLGVTPDSGAELARFVQGEGVRHEVALVPMDALRWYGVTTYPHGVLVGPEGRVLWQGPLDRMTDRVLEAYVARVRTAPAAPAQFALVDAERRAGRYAAVAQALERHRRCERLDSLACRYVLDTLAWIEWFAEVSLAGASADEQAGRWGSAVRTYEELEAAYAGAAVERDARAARERVLADPTRAREARASHALDEARRAGRWQSTPIAREHLQRMAQAHPGTQAAAEAADLLALLR